MMIRSASMGEFAKRILFLLLFCISVHCGAVAIRSDGEGNPFDLTQSENLRAVLIVCAVLGVSGFLLRPGKKRPLSDLQSGGEEPVRQGQPQPPVAAVAQVQAPAPEPPTAAVAPEPPVPAPVASAPEPVPAPVASVPVPAAPAPAPDPVAPVPRTVPPRASVPTDSSSPDELWEQARAMPHGFIPDPRTDYGYLSLLSRAAQAGQIDAQLKLGEYATRRGALVESYYWLKLAKLCGAQARNLDWSLHDCCNQWVWNGCMPEYENVYAFFSERQGVLGRAALRIDSGMDVFPALMRLREMAAQGDAVATLFLGKNGAAENASAKAK